ncbi:MAG TPA: DUF3108 domain-containing protein [Bryobacteraceae bacterium]|nr:DUF3108 domain-containing protein [Bryobacteraceae bacterium]
MIPASLPQSWPPSNAPATFPSKEKLSYEVEWRLIYAGNAHLEVEPDGPPNKSAWQLKLHLESAGLVSKLYRLDDNYSTRFDDRFCTSATTMDAQERSRHHETKVDYDSARGKASYVERDLLKNTVFKTAETDIPACVSDIMAGLYKLRTLRLEPGQSEQIPLSDGKKTISARVEAQARESIKTKAGSFNTIRCEAFVFNGLLYARKAQLLIWLTDDARHLPVQVRARMSFPIGSITLELEKEEHS